MARSESRFEPRLERSVTVLGEWQPALADEVAGADWLVAGARRRLPGLAAKVSAPSKACRGSLERMILPGAALYLELCAHMDARRALSVTGTCIATASRRAARRAGVLDRTPWTFPLLRYVLVRSMRTRFVPPAWDARMLEDSPHRVRFDITRCYYLDTLTLLGIPELTACYCYGDDLFYGSLRHVEFGRTGTLGRGDDRCDFCFQRRIGAPGDGRDCGHDARLVGGPQPLDGSTRPPEDAGTRR